MSQAGGSRSRSSGEGFEDPYADYENRDPFGAAVAATGGEVTYGPMKKVAELIAGCRNADILVTFETLFTERVIEALEDLRFIVRSDVGYDNVDVAAATRRGVLVSNAPGNCNDEMVSHALEPAHHSRPVRITRLVASQQLVEVRHLPGQRLHLGRLHRGLRHSAIEVVR